MESLGLDMLENKDRSITGGEAYRKFYFTDGMKMYSDKIAKFVCRCEKETKGRVSQRISRIYPKIYSTSKYTYLYIKCFDWKNNT